MIFEALQFTFCSDHFRAIKFETDLYTVVGEYSLNARVNAAVEGLEGLATVLDICRRNDSGKFEIMT